MLKIRILGVPLDLGQERRGVDMGPSAVRAALETHPFRSQARLGDRLTDPYLNFVRGTLQRHPRLRVTRLYEMIRPRGYTGSVVQLRRAASTLSVSFTRSTS